MTKMLLLYLHGFNSSPQSVKAQQMAQYIGTNRPDIELVVPQLSCYPAAAWRQIETIITNYPEHQLGVIGSSLGGYLATRVGQQYHCPAVLINPAVKPYELLIDYLGENINPYTQLRYTLAEQHINELKALDCQPLIDPQHIWVLLQTDDEVLDYRQATEKYQAAKLTVEQGGDHAFIGFERYLSEIVTFLAFD